MSARNQADYVLFYDKDALEDAESTFDYMFDRYYPDDPSYYESPYGLGRVYSAIENIGRQIHHSTAEYAARRRVGTARRDPLEFIKADAAKLIARALFKARQPEIWNYVGYDRLDDD